MIDFFKELGIYAGVGIIAFALGTYFASLRNDTEKKDYELQHVQELVTAVTDNAKTEKELQGKVNNAVANAGDAEKNLNREFDNRRDALYDKLQSNNPRSNKDMSNSSKAPLAIQTSECKCHVVNRKEFQRLYEKQLIVARDCDITATHYNELIKLWNDMFSKEP